MKITTIGIDLAKNVFQVHGADDHWKAVLRTVNVGTFVDRWPPVCQVAVTLDSSPAVFL